MPEYYETTITALRPGAEPIAVSQLVLSELQGWGWHGEVRFAPPDTISANHIGGVFGWISVAGIVAGDAVIIKVLPKPAEEDEDVDDTELSGPLTGRVWPSVVSGVEVVPGHSSNSSPGAICQISFADPLTYWFSRPIWGAFTNASPGELLGGAMSLANGGDGRPTLTPVLSNMPMVRIYQNIRPDLSEIPYAIATGETLGEWLTYLMGQFGVRIEMKGDRHGVLGIELKDFRPAGDVLTMNLTNSAVETVNRSRAYLLALGYTPDPQRRSTVLDNLVSGDFQRLGLSTGSVDTVIDAAQVSAEEAETRSDFSVQRANLQKFSTRILTGQPALTPGQLVAFSGEESSSSGAALWQAGNVRHFFRGQVYWNRADIYIGDVAFRPPVLLHRSRSLIVSAAVDDGESDAGAPVARDHLNRIPVRLSFAQDPEDEPGDGSEEEPVSNSWPPRQVLTVLERMAGESHGFLSVHRQGDVCRVAVRNPLFAEIIGFVYRDNLPVGADLVDSSAGVVVQHDEEDWSGLVFRPRSDVEEEADASSDPDEPDTDADDPVDSDSDTEEPAE